MSDAPERIWALSDRRKVWQDEPPSDGQHPWHWTEYVRADLAADPWRTIETAPKDGTEICAWVGPGYYGGWLQVRWHKYNGVEAWRDWDLDTWEPTHWMPLSAPPNPAD